MNILILISNFFLPIIIIFVGILYWGNSSKHINSIWSLIISSVMSFTGISTGYEASNDNSSNKLILLNKQYGMIWICSGLIMLTISSILLLINKTEINKMSGLLLELQSLIIIAIYVTLEFLFKRKYYNKLNK